MRERREGEQGGREGGGAGKDGGVKERERESLNSQFPVEPV